MIEYRIYALTDKDAHRITLSTIQEIFTRKAIVFSPVGGDAVRAILGKDIQDKRKNGTKTDFDGLAWGPDEVTILEAIDEVRQSLVDVDGPDLGIELAEFGQVKRTNGPLAILSGLRVDADRFFLTYGEIEEEIPTETMRLTGCCYGGVELPCLPAKTILFRYLVRGGEMKPKDDKRLLELENYIVNHWTEQPEDYLYRPYLRFAEKVREQYPLQVGLYHTYWWLDHILGDRISGSGSYLYNRSIA